MTKLQKFLTAYFAVTTCCTVMFLAIIFAEYQNEMRRQAKMKGKTPWVVVCNGKGDFTYTDEKGDSAYMICTSHKEAEKYMEYEKKRQDKDQWHVCAHTEDPVFQPSTLTVKGTSTTSFSGDSYLAPNGVYMTDSSDLKYTGVNGVSVSINCSEWKTAVGDSYMKAYKRPEDINKLTVKAWDSKGVGYQAEWKAILEK